MPKIPEGNPKVTGDGEELAGRLVEARIDRPEITASEISAFSFCERGWWLERFWGVRSTAPCVQEGRAAHAQVGQLIASTTLCEWVVKVCVVVATLALLGAVVLQVWPGLGR